MSVIKSNNILSIILSFDVNYSDKEIVKNLKCRWSKENKLWFSELKIQNQEEKITDDEIISDALENLKKELYDFNLEKIEFKLLHHAPEIIIPSEQLAITKRRVWDIYRNNQKEEHYKKMSRIENIRKIKKIF